MAFNGNFTATQTTDSSGFTLADTSTGADGNLTDRQVLIYKTDGTLLTGSAIDWPIANSSLILTGILPKDYSLTIVVSWISSSPLAPPSTYTKTSVNTFTGNTNDFIYGLVQQLAAKLSTTSDGNFIQNMFDLQTYLNNVVLAQKYNSQGNAQENLDIAYGYILNQNIYF